MAQKSKKSSNFDKKFPTVGLHVTDTHLKSSRAIKTRDLIASLKMKERVKMETKKAYFKKLQDKKDFLLASQDLSKIVYVACFAKTKNNLFLSISETYSQQIRFVRSSGYVTQFQGLPHSSKRGPEAQRALSTFGRAKLLKIQATKLVIIFKGKVGQREQLVEFLTRRSKMKVLFLGAVTATPHNGCRGWKRKRTKRKRRRGRFVLRIFGAEEGSALVGSSNIGYKKKTFRKKRKRNFTFSKKKSVFKGSVSVGGGALLKKK